MVYFRATTFKPLAVLSKSNENEARNFEGEFNHPIIIALKYGKVEVEGLNITKIVKLIHKVKNLIYNIPAGTSCKMA